MNNFDIETNCRKMLRILAPHDFDLAQVRIRRSAGPQSEIRLYSLVLGDIHLGERMAWPFEAAHQALRGIASDDSTDRISAPDSSTGYATIDMPKDPAEDDSFRLVGALYLQEGHRQLGDIFEEPSLNDRFPPVLTVDALVRTFVSYLLSAECGPEDRDRCSGDIEIWPKRATISADLVMPTHATWFDLVGENSHLSRCASLSRE